MRKARRVEHRGLRWTAPLSFLIAGGFPAAHGLVGCAVDIPVGAVTAGEGGGVGTGGAGDHAGKGGSDAGTGGSSTSPPSTGGSAGKSGADTGEGGGPDTGEGGSETATGGSNTSGGGSGPGAAGADDGGSSTSGGTGGGEPGGGTSGSGTSGSAGTGPIGGPESDDVNSGPDTMGYIGCYSADSTAEGYRRIGGNRMWGPYDVAGGVVQAWTTASSSHWQQFENQVQLFGPPVAVWIQICIFTSGATIDEVRQMVRAARAHAPNAFLYVTGQPDYEAGHVCSLVGPGGPALTDSLAKQIAEEDPDVHYAGTLGPLYYGDYNSDPDDGCQATTEGEDKLGTQAKAIWGQP